MQLEVPCSVLIDAQSVVVIGAEVHVHSDHAVTGEVVDVKGIEVVAGAHVEGAASHVQVT
ncbi:hypothetical protein D3C75_1087470 [compost metagenome]